MDTVAFISGAVLAGVVIQLIATVMLLLKIKKLEEFKADTIGNFDSVWRSMDDNYKELLSETRSYTDSRFDKIVFKK